MAKTSFFRETYAYASQAREFSGKDWLAYAAWVGLMMGLLAAVGGFMAIGAYAMVATHTSTAVKAVLLPARLASRTTLLAARG